MSARVSTSWDQRDAGSPPPFDPQTFVTRVSERSPEWKSHTSLGTARQAIGYRRRGYRMIREIWVHQDGEWTLVESRDRE